MMNSIETLTSKQPRNGSDYSIVHTKSEAGERRAILAAIDTIGQSATSRMKKLISRVDKAFEDVVLNSSNSDLEAMDSAVTKILLDENIEIQNLNKQNRDIFGFCITVCIVHNNLCRVLQLGDCRAYLMQHLPEQAPTVNCLTADQNNLATIMGEEEEYIFLSNELLELSRTLICYWGKPNQDAVREMLEAAKKTIELPNACCLFLTTDGIYLPLIRILLDYSNFKLTLEQFSLEPWLVNFLDTEGYLTEENQWDQIAPALTRQAMNYASKKTRYKDDIATVTAWLE